MNRARRILQLKQNLIWCVFKVEKYLSGDCYSDQITTEKKTFLTLLPRNSVTHFQNALSARGEISQYSEPLVEISVLNIKYGKFVHEHPPSFKRILP